MTIDIKDRGTKYLPVLNRYTPKNPKSGFYQTCETKYLSGVATLIILQQFICMMYNSISQKPHVHLFQQSEH